MINIFHVHKSLDTKNDTTSSWTWEWEQGGGKFNKRNMAVYSVAASARLCHRSRINQNGLLFQFFILL